MQNHRVEGILYQNNAIITTETMQVQTLQDLEERYNDRVYKIVKMYAEQQYSCLGYVNLDFIMDVTGVDFIIIMQILYEEDYYPLPLDGTKWVKE